VRAWSPRVRSSWWCGAELPSSNEHKRDGSHQHDGSRDEGDNPVAYRAAARGTPAAEALTQHDRGRLLWTLYGSGMSVADDGNCSAPEHSDAAGERWPGRCRIMPATPQEAMNTANTRNTCDQVAAVEKLGVFESIPALPFLAAVAAVAAVAVYAVLPQPWGRLMCHGLGRVLPADYVCELTSTLQSASGRLNRQRHTYCGYCRYSVTVDYVPT